MSLAAVAGTIFLASVVTILVSLLVVLLSDDDKRKKRPPGPYGLPFVGYLPFLTSKPHLKLIELKKKYGPIFSIRMGSRDVLILCDYQSQKESFGTNAFMGRPPYWTFELSEETERLKAFTGTQWKDHKRFSLHMFRDLGFGNIKMEPHIKEEISELLGRFSETVDRPVRASIMLAPSMSNNISSLVFGKRRKFDDPKRIMLDQLLREFAMLNNQMGWQAFFPWIRAVSKYFGLGRYKSMNKILEKLYNYIEEEVEEHKQTLEKENIRDFLDGYLLEISKRKDDLTTTFKESVMKDFSRMFFGAGSETVRATMDWLLLVCAAFPQVQDKVQMEVDDAIGKDRLPSFSEDSKNLPYTRAVIAELMRWRTIAPINVMRYTLEDSELGGYFIPAGSYVTSNIWAVHHDPELWGNDVVEFRPERFLSEDGKEFRKPEYFMPFSIGKRACPGKSLADTEVFMYFTSVLQKFRIELPKGAKADFEGVLGITLQTKPYDIVFKNR